MNERELVEGIARKDEEAARTLVEQYGGLLRAAIRRHAPGLDEEDLLADALLAVWQNIQSFDRRGSFKNWAAAVARYRAIDAVRKAARSMPAGDGAQLEALGGATLDEYLTLELEDLFRGLSPADRDLLLARYYYGKGFYVHSTTTDHGYIRALFVKELKHTPVDLTPAMKE